MINRRNRFHGHHSVSRVRGSLKHSINFSLRIDIGKKDEYRLAVVVSKKIDKRAVVRNKIRRRVFEIFRTQELLNNNCVDVVVYVKNVATADMPHKDLSDEIAQLATKALKSQASSK